VVGGFVGQARHEDERDVGQELTGKPVQPADLSRSQLIDLSLGVFIARRCDLSGGRHADEHGRDQEDDAGIRRAAAPVQTSRPAVFPEEVP
jgi:hypothetical protein